MTASELKSHAYEQVLAVDLPARAVMHVESIISDMSIYKASLNRIRLVTAVLGHFYSEYDLQLGTLFKINSTLRSSSVDLDCATQIRVDTARLIEVSKIAAALSSFVATTVAVDLQCEISWEPLRAWRVLRLL